MSNNFKQYNHPRIVIDNTVNNINASGNIKYITVEEWQDLLHHTHTSDSIVGGSSSGGEVSEVTLAEFNALIARVKALEEENISLKQNIQTMNETINNINTNTGFEIGDWDIDSPGRQDPEGHTIPDN